MNDVLTILLGVLLTSALLIVTVAYRLVRTRLVQQQQELHHSNARLLQLSTMSPIVLYTCVASGDFRITWVSDNIMLQLGYSPVEVLADPDFWHNHIHPDDRVSIFGRLTELFVQGQHIHEYRFRIKNGEYRWILNPLRIVIDADGVAQEIVGTFIDVTENRAMRVALIEREQQLHAILNNAPDGIITINQEGRIKSFNVSAEAIFGYRADEVTGRHFSLLIPDSAASGYDNDLNRYVEAGIHHAVHKVTARRHDGSKFPLALTIGVFTQESQHMFIGMVRDITADELLQQEITHHREQLEIKVAAQTRELVTARDIALAAERAMAAFLANMSHELRTPLHGILSYASFGTKKLQRVPAEKLGEYFHEIHDSGTLLLNLVNNLLDLSKLRAGKMAYEFVTVDLSGIAKDVVHELQPLWQQKNMNISIECTADQILVTIDAVKISQVFRNLLINAIKFSRAQSQIIIQLFILTDGSIQFTVSDEGPGVPNTELESIFLPFAQGSHTRSGAGGTGLGLPICREIIHAGHGGRIWAENRPTGGARFIVTLPMAQPLSQAQGT